MWGLPLGIKYPVAITDSGAALLSSRRIDSGLGGPRLDHPENFGTMVREVPLLVITGFQQGIRQPEVGGESHALWSIGE